ncbi:MAG: DevR family CRISPR-associated autoregulator [Armatimonadetes bacterium]|nr:DevR family CRISPR-associated autoregulator [Armatimonadota bacterium]MDW8154303.1 DevR family CRISPR-associated autoregulator [Armatimonadota bacterium]
MTEQDLFSMQEGQASHDTEGVEGIPLPSEQQTQSQSTPDANQQGVFEIAILARVTWNLHSLNNEGSIGNVTEPRTVMLWDGTKTDGVSGEMMKHIHAYWTWLQAKTKNLALCPACRTFQPQRADAARQELNQNDNAQAMGTAITRCVLCDLHGFLVQRPTIHRQSTVEFGWIVGVPGKFYRDIHVHARHAVAERGVADKTEEGGEEEEAQQQATDEAKGTEVAAQMLYHRPTRSGVYALVTLFQPWRIGLNEVNYTYVLAADEQKRRFKVALTAYEWALKRPDGAMTTTRFPHILGIEGIVLISRQPVPVPMLSPLKEDYRKKVKGLKGVEARKEDCREKVKGLAEKEVEAREFDDLDGLVNILAELKEEAPFRMSFQETPSTGESGSAGEATGRRGGRSRRAGGAPGGSEVAKEPTGTETAEE